MKKSFVALLLLPVLALSGIGLIACDTQTLSETPAFVHADGAKIIDTNGNAIGLMGTNLGGWLVQESWLVPTDIGREYGQIDMMVTLANRFGLDGMQELLDVYETSWVTEDDFANIKALGFNCVRIPFTYLNFMNVVKLSGDEYVRTPYEELEIDPNKFARLDWAIEMCKKYDLYAILDMHGAVGSQSGNDHSGDISHPEGGELYLQNDTGQTCREKTKELWRFIANRYKDETIVAVYDILNEPGLKTNGTQSTGGKIVQNYFDELYKAIREVDNNHMVSMESCWTPFELPAPQTYGWENVMYQYHHYNWASSNVANSAYYTSQIATNNWVTTTLKYNVPVLIGEFNVWGDSHSDKTNVQSDQTDEQAMSGVIELYCALGWNFTTWNFKHAAEHSSWGIFNYSPSAQNMHEHANYLTMQKDEIAGIWARHTAQNYTVNQSLVDCIIPHLSSFNTNGNDNRTVEEITKNRTFYILTYDQNDEEQ